MPRNLIIYALILALVAVMGLYVLPWAKSKFFGESLQVRVRFTNAFEDYDVEVPGRTETVARTVVSMEIDFPMGSAPESVNDLQVVDNKNQQVEVNWGGAGAEKDDIPERGITQWKIREAFFPIGFREGTLKTQIRDLTYFVLPQVKSADAVGK